MTKTLDAARTLEGIINDAETGQPIPHARVRFDLGFWGLTFGDANGGVDWKARHATGPNVVALAFVTDPRTVTPPSMEAVADEQGRFHLPLCRQDSYPLKVTPPDGSSYLPRTISVPWPTEAVRQRKDITLTPTVRVRGKVTEGRLAWPVAGARVDFWCKGLVLPEGVRFPHPVHTDADGAFTALLPHGQWHVVVTGPAATTCSRRSPRDCLPMRSRPATVRPA